MNLLQGKTVLLVDDEQAFLEALEDALVFAGATVLKARDVSTALRILESQRLDIVTVDIMLSPGVGLADQIESEAAGVYLCQVIARKYPLVKAFCLSVANAPSTIEKINKLKIPFLKKGEIPLRTVLGLLESSISGIAYSTDRPKKPKRPSY